MTTPHRRDLHRPGPPPPSLVLRRSWPLLAAAAAIAVLALIPSMVSRMDTSIPIAERDLTPTCDSLSPALPGARLPAGLPGLSGQFVYQTASVDRTSLTFTAVPDPDLDAVVAQLTAALRAGAHTATLRKPPPALPDPPRGLDRISRSAVLDITGPTGRGSITVSGRCTSQTAIAYTLTPP